MWANRALEQQWIEDNKYKGAYTNNKGQTSAFTFQERERERERESGVGAREPEDGLADWNVTHTHIYMLHPQDLPFWACKAYCEAVCRCE